MMTLVWPWVFLWQGQIFSLGFYIQSSWMVEDFDTEVKKHSYIGEHQDNFFYALEV